MSVDGTQEYGSTRLSEFSRTSKTCYVGQMASSSSSLCQFITLCENARWNSSVLFKVTACSDTMALRLHSVHSLCFLTFFSTWVISQYDPTSFLAELIREDIKNRCRSLGRINMDPAVWHARVLESAAERRNVDNKFFGLYSFGWGHLTVFCAHLGEG